MLLKRGRCPLFYLKNQKVIWKLFEDSLASVYYLYLMDFKKLQLPLLFCLTLGLAPYTPEPHILGKVRWLLGGANGMQALDWFDLLMHGFPWLYLLYVITKGVKPNKTLTFLCFFLFGCCLWVNL